MFETRYSMTPLHVFMSEHYGAVQAAAARSGGRLGLQQALHLQNVLRGTNEVNRSLRREVFKVQHLVHMASRPYGATSVDDGVRAFDPDEHGMDELSLLAEAFDEAVQATWPSVVTGGSNERSEN